MTREQIQEQAIRIEGFKEGYMAALMWISTQLPAHKPETPKSEEPAK